MPTYPLLLPAHFVVPSSMLFLVIGNGMQGPKDYHPRGSYLFANILDYSTGKLFNIQRRNSKPSYAISPWNRTAKKEVSTCRKFYHKQRSMANNVAEKHSFKGAANSPQSSHCCSQECHNGGASGEGGNNLAIVLPPLLKTVWFLNSSCLTPRHLSLSDLFLVNIIAEAKLKKHERYTYFEGVWFCIIIEKALFWNFHKGPGSKLALLSLGVANVAPGHAKIIYVHLTCLTKELRCFGMSL